MASARPLAVRKGGAVHFPWHRHEQDLHGEESARSAPRERRRIRKVAIYGSARTGKRASVPAADHDRIEWPAEMTPPERTRPVPTVPLAMPAELAEALAELDDVADYADEIEVEVPSAAAFDNARRLLKAMYRISPRGFSVYPATGGHIVIDARGANDNIVVVSCGSDGSVLCLATIDGEDRRSWYETARTLPDGFISEALAAL